MELKTIDQLTTVEVQAQQFEVDGRPADGVWLTLGYSRLQDQSRHQLPKLLLSKSQAHTLAMALLAEAEKLPGASDQGSQTQ